MPEKIRNKHKTSDSQKSRSSLLRDEETENEASHVKEDEEVAVSGSEVDFEGEIEGFSQGGHLRFLMFDMMMIENKCVRYYFFLLASRPRHWPVIPAPVLSS